MSSIKNAFDRVNINLTIPWP